MTLIALYGWTIVAAVIAAPMLALLGIQIATRDRAMQTLCVGQGAMVGVLLGLGLLHTFERTELESFGPLATALVVSAITFLASDALVRRKPASKNTGFAFVFALLLAAGNLVGALFPALESHLAQVYFGDLATLTESASRFCAVCSVLCLGYLFVRRSGIANQSFELAVFGGVISAGGKRREGFAFQALTLFVLCLAVQFLGFLFTVAMLFLPTGLLNYAKRKGLRRHTIACAVLASSSTAVGFLLSLQFTRLPTVPAIVAVQFAFGLVYLLVEHTLYALRPRFALGRVAFPAET